MPTTRLLVCAIAMGFAADSAKASQVTIDLRSRQPAARRIEVAGHCSIVGDNKSGRHEALLGVSTGIRGEDGSYFVASTATSEIVRFNPDGSYSGAVMREGIGVHDLSTPRLGDVRRVRLVPYRGDSIAVYDAGSRRLTVLAPDGKPTRSFLLSSISGVGKAAFLVAASLPDGDFIFAESQVRTGRVGTTGRVLLRDTIAIVRLSSVGSAVWAKRGLEGPRIEIEVSASTSNDNWRSLRSSSTPGVLRVTSVAVVAGLVYYYVESRNQLLVLHYDGSVMYTILLPPMPDLGSARSAPPRQTLMMLGDGVGRLWLEVPRTARDEMRQWWIVSTKPDLVGTAFTPDRDEILFVNDSSTLFRTVDSSRAHFIRSCPAPTAR